MKITEVNCSNNEGSLEFTFNKKEMQIEGCQISADYSLIADNKYNLQVYIGFIDMDIMEKLWDMQVKSTPGQIKTTVKDLVSSYFNVKENRKVMRDRLKVMDQTRDFPFTKLDSYEIDISRIEKDTTVLVVANREAGCYTVYKVVGSGSLELLYNKKIDSDVFDIHQINLDLKEFFKKA